VRSQYTHISSS